MSNIESTPEGFNMLRRMYENVQEPLLNATTMSGNAGNNNVDSANPFAALLGNTQGRDASNNAETGTVPNTNPLPNPWGGAAAGKKLYYSHSHSVSLHCCTYNAVKMTKRFVVLLDRSDSYAWKDEFRWGYY